MAHLLVEVGAACSEYQDRVMRHLQCKAIQVDEIWSFVGCKQKNAKVYANAELVPSCLLGNRDRGTAEVFMKD